MDSWGQVLAELEPADRKVLERLMAKVEIDSVGCWLWQGHLNAGGYAEIWADGRSRLAHRISYELFRGPIPAGRQLDHLCRIRRCVSPLHLEPVTAKENIQRGETGAVNAAKTHCPSGHLYDEENTYHYRRGDGLVLRFCRACRREKQRRKRAGR